MSKTFLSP